MKLLPEQEVFFSHINYSDTIFNISFNADIRQAEDCHALLITGIAKSDDLVKHAKSKFVSVKHLKYPDHYDFKPNDIKEIIGAYESLPSPKIMLTTEKDYMRLSQEHGIVKNCTIFRFQLASISQISLTKSLAIMYKKIQEATNYIKDKIGEKFLNLRLF